MTAARSLFVAGLVVIIFVIASRKIQETLFGWEIGDIPVSAYAALAIGIICVFASIICFVTGIALKKSRLYLEEISMPADPADDFAQRLSKAGLVWLLVPMIFCIGIQAPNIIHNIKTHEENVPKRWAVVRELDEVFPGLRSTYSDREITRRITIPSGFTLTARGTAKQSLIHTHFQSRWTIPATSLKSSMSSTAQTGKRSLP